jgi:flavin-binding protein dodecin
MPLPAPVTIAIFAIPFMPDMVSAPANLRDNAGRSPPKVQKQTEMNMAENVYKVIELIGTSTVSWEKAAAAAIARAGKTLRDLRVAEVVELDIQLKDGKIEAYRAKIKVSFKYERGK